MDTALFGLIDFSQDNIPVEKIKALYESDFPYLQLTPEGEKELYGVPEKTNQKLITSKTTTKKKTKKILAP